MSFDIILNFMTTMLTIVTTVINITIMDITILT